MKVVVRSEVIKSVKDKNDKAQLEYFKKELIKILAKNCGFSVSRFILAAVHYFKNTNRI